MPSPGDPLFHALSRLSRIPFTDASLQAVVEQCADLAAELLDGPLAASVTLARLDGAGTVAASAPAAADLDDIQYRSGSGPCLEAARSGRPTGFGVPRADARWPPVAAELARRGWHGLWSVPLPARQPVTGSLNPYLGRDAATAPTRWSATQQLAGHAAVTVWNAHCFEDAVRLTGNLRRALESRSVIDQAKGALMERCKVTADRVFDTLVRISNGTNTKLRDVAQTLVYSGGAGGLPPTT